MRKWILYQEDWFFLKEHHRLLSMVFPLHLLRSGMGLPLNLAPRDLRQLWNPTMPTRASFLTPSSTHRSDSVGEGIIWPYGGYPPSATFTFLANAFHLRSKDEVSWSACCFSSTDSISHDYNPASFIAEGLGWVELGEKKECVLRAAHSEWSSGSDLGSPRELGREATGHGRKRCGRGLLMVEMKMEMQGGHPLQRPCHAAHSSTSVTSISIIPGWRPPAIWQTFFEIRASPVTGHPTACSKPVISRRRDSSPRPIVSMESLGSRGGVWWFLAVYAVKSSEHQTHTLFAQPRYSMLISSFLRSFTSPPSG